MSAPAGWYPEPDNPGMSRWWDGNAWADMRAPDALVPAPPSKAGLAFQLVGQVGWLLMLLAVLAVILVFLFG